MLYPYSIITLLLLRPDLGQPFVDLRKCTHCSHCSYLNPSLPYPSPSLASIPNVHIHPLPFLATIFMTFPKKGHCLDRGVIVASMFIAYVPAVVPIKAATLCICCGFFKFKFYHICPVFILHTVTFFIDLVQLTVK